MEARNETRAQRWAAAADKYDKLAIAGLALLTRVPRWVSGSDQTSIEMNLAGITLLVLLGMRKAEIPVGKFLAGTAGHIADRLLGSPVQEPAVEGAFEKKMQ